ncbi:MAG: ABC transporter substrate-binding protein [Myxococcales bacterium]|nr:ABC transporter substrate-binding protein [Myxococcales bacterium]
MGRELSLGAPCARVVSLVPSETETVFMLGAAATLVGRTDYCVEPRGAIERVPAVGGTKDARVEDIAALSPDIVLCNQEENTPSIVRDLERRGIRVHVSFPKSVDDARELVCDIAALLGIDPERSTVVAKMDDELARARDQRAKRTPVRAFCPIWMDPLMTIHGDTFISDAMDLAGAFNVFCDRPRRYPLAADLGIATPYEGARVAGRDTRYPRVTLDEVRARGAVLTILPDEPHPFSESDASVFRSIEGMRVRFVSGRDLCWYSPRMGEGILALAEALAQ